VQLSVPGVQLPDAPLVFDIRIFRVFYRHQPQAVLLFINLTSRWRSFHQLQLMSEIGRYFSASLNIDKVLRTVLTCITAGNALGFNRAFLLLVDEKKEHLKGTLALGASSASEAQHIWHELAENEWSLQQILDAADNISESLSSSTLQKELSELEIDLDNPLLPALQISLEEHRTLRIARRELLASELPENITETHRHQWQQAAALFTASEMVIAPLMAKDRLVGVVLADNAFSGNLIEESDVQLLDSLAGQAGLTIDNARTYQELQKAQKELVNSERLAVVGDMTARLSHEIRNPLATIGGFARRLVKHPEDAEMVQRNASVIVNETERLEELLNDLLEMALPSQIELESQHLSEVLDQALLLASADFIALNVEVERDYDPSIPEVHLDRARLLQALLNIVRNGAQAMPNGGVLRVSTTMKNPDTVQIRISDQGKGISENALKHVFDPFYSTKIKGSGLGLPITWQIIQDHGGNIEVESEINKGTTFIISLPLQSPKDEQTA
jgi:signal transduction histidine kinase